MRDAVRCISHESGRFQYIQRQLGWSRTWPATREVEGKSVNPSPTLSKPVGFVMAPLKPFGKKTPVPLGLPKVRMLISCKRINPNSYLNSVTEALATALRIL